MKFVVEYRGKPVAEVNKGFARLIRLAGLGTEVVPHTLRHTCATWLSQRGANMTDARGVECSADLVDIRAVVPPQRDHCR